MISSPPIRGPRASSTVRVPRARSMSRRRSPSSSPRGSRPHAPRSTATRRWSGMASARAATSAIDVTGRSDDGSTAAPSPDRGFG